MTSVPVTNRAELLSALRAGKFDAILGTPESDWLDFKSAPYRMDIPKGPWEYAKDVASFANAAGGLIVIGYKTEKTATDLESKAASCGLVPKALVDAKQMADTLLNLVYPEMRDVELRWFPDDASESSGVLVIDVPPQRDQDKKFILKKVFTDEGKYEPALAIPTRAGANTNWTHAETIHADLGRARFANLVGALEELVGQLRAVTAKDSLEILPSSDQSQRANERIDAMIREMQWKGTPAYFLQAIPPANTRVLEQLHGSGGVSSALQRPAVLRSLGWHFASGLEPEVRGGGLAVVQGNRSMIWIDRDGFATSGVTADPEFLGWAMNQGREGKPGPYVINSLALVEYTLEFFRFVHAVLVPRAASGRWILRIATRGFKDASGGVKLAGGPPHQWHRAVKLATGDVLGDEIASSGDAKRDSFEALERVYGLFGLGSEDIPFTEGRSVSEELVMKQ